MMTTDQTLFQASLYSIIEKDNYLSSISFCQTRIEIFDRIVKVENFALHFRKGVTKADTFLTNRAALSPENITEKDTI